MKKNVTIILAALLAVSLTACGNSNESSSADQQTPSNTSTAAENSKPEESSASTEASKPDETSQPSSDNNQSVNGTVDLLTAAWNNVPEDSKFPVFGGAPGADIEDLTENAPGNFAIDDPGILDNHLGFPAVSADKIDSAASLIHMMNANTFTAGAYHVKDAGTISDVTAAIKDNVMNRQWMCGFPEKLVIVTVDDYIVSVFGHGEPIDAFISSLTAAYPSAKTVCDEPITLGGDPVADVGGLGIPLDWWRTDNEMMYL